MHKDEIFKAVERIQTTGEVKFRNLKSLEEIKQGSITGSRYEKQKNFLYGFYSVLAYFTI